MLSEFIAKRKAELKKKSIQEFIDQVGDDVEADAAAIQAYNEGRGPEWYVKQKEMDAKIAEIEAHKAAIEVKAKAKRKMLETKMTAAASVDWSKIKTTYAHAGGVYAKPEPEVIDKYRLRQEVLLNITGVIDDLLFNGTGDVDPNELIEAIARINNAYAAKFPQYINPITRDEDMTHLDNDDVVAQRLLRDKAIIAMHLLRVAKKEGAKGVGANREDHPVFRDVVNLWFSESAIHGEELEKIEIARSRVTKYQRQLQASPYWDEIQDPKKARYEMMAHVRTQYAAAADKELENHLKEETYGGW